MTKRTQRPLPPIPKAVQKLSREALERRYVRLKADLEERHEMYRELETEYCDTCDVLDDLQEEIRAWQRGERYMEDGTVKSVPLPPLKPEPEPSPTPDRSLN